MIVKQNIPKKKWEKSIYIWIGKGRTFIKRISSPYMGDCQHDIETDFFLGMQGFIYIYESVYINEYVYIRICIYVFYTNNLIHVHALPHTIFTQ